MRAIYAQRAFAGAVVAAELPINRLSGACGAYNAGGGTVRFETFSFGSVRIDGVTYDHDMVIDRGEVRKRKKKPSKKFREAFGHTPLSFEEEMPWRCRRLMICTGSGALPVLGKCSEKPSAARSNS